MATAAAPGTIDTVATLLMICAPQPLKTTFSQPHDLPITVTPTLTALDGLSPSTCSEPGTEIPKNGPQDLTNPLGIIFGTVFSSKLLNGATATSTPPAAVQVVANQTVQVTVVFTFN
jgi:hypothetical protein